MTFDFRNQERRNRVNRLLARAKAAKQDGDLRRYSLELFQAWEARRLARILARNG